MENLIKQKRELQTQGDELRASFQDVESKLKESKCEEKKVPPKICPNLSHEIARMCSADWKHITRRARAASLPRSCLTDSSRQTKDLQKGL